MATYFDEDFHKLILSKYTRLIPNEDGLARNFGSN